MNNNIKRLLNLIIQIKSLDKWPSDGQTPLLVILPHTPHPPPSYPYQRLFTGVYK